MVSNKRRFLCKKLPKPHQPEKLDDFEAHHATKVLRLSNGDLVDALDGNGHAAVAQLRVRGGDVWLEHTEQTSELIVQDLPSENTTARIILELAMLKGDAMEWAIEKAVELNVSELIPVITDHTVVQVKEKGAEVFQGRWQKIADQALKQCGRLHRMKVHMPTPLLSLPLLRTEGTIRLWCFDNEKTNLPSLLKTVNKQKEYHLLVGPEGGWSEKEITFLQRQRNESPNSLSAISLGPLVLRAETAAIHGVSLLTGYIQNT